MQNVTLCAAAALRWTHNGTKASLKSNQNFYIFAIISRDIFIDHSIPQKSYLVQTQRCKNQSDFILKSSKISDLPRENQEDQEDREDREDQEDRDDGEFWIDFTDYVRCPNMPSKAHFRLKITNLCAVL